jgi:hypothetical protein
LTSRFIGACTCLFLVSSRSAFGLILMAFAVSSNLANDVAIAHGPGASWDNLVGVYACGVLGKRVRPRLTVLGRTQAEASQTADGRRWLSEAARNGGTVAFRSAGRLGTGTRLAPFEKCMLIAWSGSQEVACATLAVSGAGRGRARARRHPAGRWHRLSGGHDGGQGSAVGCASSMAKCSQIYRDASARREPDRWSPRVGTVGVLPDP